MTDPSPLTGFYPRQRTRRVECDWLEPEDGAAKLFALVRCDLPLGVVDSLPFGQGHSYREVWDAIAPFVLEWNALGWDATSEARVPVPAPAEGGPDVFQWVDPIISDWLAFVLKTTYRTVVSDEKKSASSGGPSSASVPVSVSSNPANASRKNPKTPASTSAST